ncbi:MAG: VWA domain-containing protein [Actinomycetia bacterium]|nr:VWA domain-containing protein [Actinomycetes bacterium]MCP3913823.1 VWA domain-containing protein [Actinomycetes bacterium]MCP4083623.1 VWA domain-containing protein [Actinomycetes bacterium]
MPESGYFLDLEQAIAQSGHWLWRRLKPRGIRESEADDRVAHLGDHRSALTALLRVLSGEALNVRAARDVGGLRGRDLLLPEQIGLAADKEGNRMVYVVRVALAAGWSLGLAPAVDRELDPELDWIRRSCLLAARMSSDLPHFGGTYLEVASREAGTRVDPGSLRGRAGWLEHARQAALTGGQPWSEAEIIMGCARSRGGKSAAPVLVWGEPITVDAQLVGSHFADGAPPASEGTEVEAPPFEELRVLLLDESDEMDVPIHGYEKVETLDNWSGGMRGMDGSDELDDQLEALEEIDLRDLIRGGEQAQSVYRADIALDVSIPDISRVDPGKNGIGYDEWDWRRGVYRKNWTTVYPTAVPLGSDEWAARATSRWAREIDELHWRLQRHRLELETVKRRLDGEEVDLDALVGEVAAVRAGHGGNNRLYARRERRRRDHATCVLIDVSLSTDAWVGERRVIDIAREAVLVLGEVADRLGDQLRIMAFASHTRNQVHVWDVLGWDEQWSSARARLGLLSPQGYTRIGPALRHATADLLEVDAQRKLMLLLTDGKPSDYDRYEGRYGVADVRQAVREAANSSIWLHGLAVQASAQDYLPSMLGSGRWDLLTNPNDLPEVLTLVHGRMAAT